MTGTSDLSHILDTPIIRDESQRRSVAQRFIDGGAADLLEMVGLEDAS